MRKRGRKEGERDSKQRDEKVEGKRRYGCVLGEGEDRNKEGTGEHRQQLYRRVVHESNNRTQKKKTRQ